MSNVPELDPSFDIPSKEEGWVKVNLKEREKSPYFRLYVLTTEGFNFHCGKEHPPHSFKGLPAPERQLLTIVLWEKEDLYVRSYDNEWT